MVIDILITIGMILALTFIIVICQISKYAEEWEQELQRLKEEDKDERK